MKLPLSWIKDWIDTGLSNGELAKRLTMAGIEVDALEKAPLPFEGVVVGLVLEAKPHPEADRLKVAIVSDGSDTFQVVCGATNCRKGLKTPFAKVGARLTGPKGETIKIKKGKLKGLDSFGMLCAEEELGLGGKSEGIYELPSSYEVGRDLTELYGDWILDISLTPNLGHCSSVLGIARELFAITEKPLTLPSFSLVEGKSPIDVKIKVEEEKGCLKYAARVIQGVKVAPSPQWLKTRLERSGIRSISNVVDVTNFVMLELGQPLHAFDLNKTEGQITIRKAKKGETLVTLDGNDQKLSPDVLVIADAKKVLAIAGVMGGAESEVSDGAVNILLEAAYFAPTAIRRSSKALHLASESHRRFERGIDPNGVLKALDRAASLITELGGGEIKKGVIDSHPAPFNKKTITLRNNRVNAHLGTQLTDQEIAALLTRLDFEVKKDHVLVPTYRSDVTAEIDLIEEVARLYGYDHIEQKTPRYSGSDLTDGVDFVFEKKLRKALLGQGLQELITSSLVSPKEAALTGEDPIALIHPSSVEQSVLRPSLLPSLLQVIRYNQHIREFDISSFEIGNIYFKKDKALEEKRVAGMILAGSTPHHPEEKARPYDFYDLKGILENIAQSLHFIRSKDSYLHPGRQAHLLQGNQVIGTLGEVHPAALRSMRVEGRIFFAQLNLDALRLSQVKELKAKVPSSQPSSERDWTLTLDEEASVGELLDKIRALPSRLLKELILLDIYRSDKLGEGKKNVTIRMVYRDDKKTLSASQVEAEHGRIKKGIEG